MARNPRTAVDAQLASNRKLVAIHAKSQDHLDQMRAKAVVRSMANVAQVQVGGAARNVLAGMLPVTVSPKARRLLAQHVGDLTVIKGIAAARKAGVPQ
jgi:hypothetical protein